MSTRPRILIVDDEKIVCEMARRSFEFDGFEVTTFTDSVKALAALQEQWFNVVIADIKMKEVDGLQLLEFVRKKWPQTRVIILTAFATTETAKEAIDKEAFDFFTKPVRISELIASVRRALQTGETENEKD